MIVFKETASRELTGKHHIFSVSPCTHPFLDYHHAGDLTSGSALWGGLQWQSGVSRLSSSSWLLVLLCGESSIVFGERHLQGVSQSYLKSKSKAWHFQRVNQTLARLNHSLELAVNLISWLSFPAVAPLNCIQAISFELG